MSNATKTRGTEGRRLVRDAKGHFVRDTRRGTTAAPVKPETAASSRGDFGSVANSRGINPDPNGQGGGIAKSQSGTDGTITVVRINGGTGEPANTQPEPAPADTAQTSPFKIQVEGKQDLTPRKRGRPTKEDVAARAVTAPSAAQAASSQTAADLILDMVNLTAVQIAGEMAAIQKQERERITAPLVRTLDRLAPEHIAIISKFADPIAVIAGLGMYAARVAAIYQFNQKPIIQRPAQPPKTNLTPTPSAEPKTEFKPSQPPTDKAEPSQIEPTLASLIETIDAK